MRSHERRQGMCPQTGELHSMAYSGFEQIARRSNIAVWARQSEIICKGMDRCPVSIPLAEDRRVFTPVARAGADQQAQFVSSYRWQDSTSRRRGAAVNSRLAGGFGFERPCIRGLAKMQRISMALTIMLAMALGRTRGGQPEYLRSLIRPAQPATARRSPRGTNPIGSQRDQSVLNCE